MQWNGSLFDVEHAHFFFVFSERASRKGENGALVGRRLSRLGPGEPGKGSGKAGGGAAHAHGHSPERGPPTLNGGKLRLVLLAPLSGPVSLLLLPLPSEIRRGSEQSIIGLRETGHTYGLRQDERAGERQLIRRATANFSGVHYCLPRRGQQRRMTRRRYSISATLM